MLKEIAVFSDASFGNKYSCFSKENKWFLLNKDIAAYGFVIFKDNKNFDDKNILITSAKTIDVVTANKGYFNYDTICHDFGSEKAELVGFYKAVLFTYLFIGTKVKVKFYSDLLSMVNWLNDVVIIKPSQEKYTLITQIKLLLSKFKNAKVIWVNRDQNKHAHNLVKKYFDELKIKNGVAVETIGVF